MSGGLALRDERYLENWLARHAPQVEMVRTAVPVPTVTAAAAAMGVECEAIIKSLLFIADGRPVLVIAGGTDRVDKSKLGAVLSVAPSGIRLATPGETADLTGYEVGAVPPVGLATPLPIYVDRRVAARETVYGGGGSDLALIRISPADILALNGATLVDVTCAPTAQADG
jgi:prolyl-tRNA editing enzyme YbaK/EbsC (Cys-tRNA(Pro) deacylase)